MRLLDELNYLDVNITSIDLKFSNKGYNFMSITLSSADAVSAILNVHPPMLNGKKVYIKPALFQPRRNLNRPVGNKKHDSKVHSKCILITWKYLVLHGFMVEIYFSDITLM